MKLDIVDKAGVNKSEFARIMRTSRTTVHSWYNGGGVHSMAQSRLRRTLLLLELAVKARDLPLPDDIRRPDREAAIARILKKHNEAARTQ